MQRKAVDTGKKKQKKTDVQTIQGAGGMQLGTPVALTPNIVGYI